MKITTYHIKKVARYYGRPKIWLFHTVTNILEELGKKRNRGQSMYDFVWYHKDVIEGLYLAIPGIK